MFGKPDVAIQINQISVLDAALAVQASALLDQLRVVSPSEPVVSDDV